MKLFTNHVCSPRKRNVFSYVCLCIKGSLPYDILGQIEIPSSTGPIPVRMEGPTRKNSLHPGKEEKQGRAVVGRSGFTTEWRIIEELKIIFTLFIMQQIAESGNVTHLSEIHLQCRQSVWKYDMPNKFQYHTIHDLKLLFCLVFALHFKYRFSFFFFCNFLFFLHLWFPC